MLMFMFSAIHKDEQGFLHPHAYVSEGSGGVDYRVEPVRTFRFVTFCAKMANGFSQVRKVSLALGIIIFA